MKHIMALGAALVLFGLISDYKFMIAGILAIAFADIFGRKEGKHV